MIGPPKRTAITGQSSARVHPVAPGAPQVPVDDSGSPGKSRPAAANATASTATNSAKPYRACTDRPSFPDLGGDGIFRRRLATTRPRNVAVEGRTRTFPSRDCAWWRSQASLPNVTGEERVAATVVAWGLLGGGRDVPAHAASCQDRAMRSATPHLRRFALLLAGAGFVIGGASIVAIVCVSARTDSGLLCDPGFAYEREEPWSGPGVCAFYDVPFWTLGFAAVCATGALLTFVTALLRPTRPRTPPSDTAPGPGVPDGTGRPTGG